MFQYDGQLITLKKKTIIDILAADLLPYGHPENRARYKEDFVFVSELRELIKTDGWMWNVYINPGCVKVLKACGYINYKTEFVPDTDTPTLIIEHFSMTLKGRWAHFLYKIKAGWRDAVTSKKVISSTFDDVIYYTFPI